MTYLDLPWIVGPMPIVATVWSAYGYGRAVSLGRGATEGGFVSAMLLPVGVISLMIQAFFSVYRLSYLLIANQFLVAASCLILVKIANRLRTNGSKLQPKDVGIFGTLKYMAICFSFWLSINVPLVIFPIQEKCTIAKCYTIEAAIGRKDAIFAYLYVTSPAGSLFLLVTLVGFGELFRKAAHWRRQ